MFNDADSVTWISSFWDRFQQQITTLKFCTRNVFSYNIINHCRIKHPQLFSCIRVIIIIIIFLFIPCCNREIEKILTWIYL